MAARILVVDDAAFMRHLVKKCLTQAGFEVAGEAGNGAEAEAQYAELKPDLVTLDMVMPEVDGLEAIRRIRKLDPKAKIVVVSAVDQRENLLEAIRLGATDYIVKPFDADRVSTAVCRALGVTPQSAGSSNA
jgi:two-component system chemotaxis response regulator CheY